MVTILLTTAVFGAKMILHKYSYVEYRKNEIRTIVLDCEGDGLYPTKIYCLSYTENNLPPVTLTKYQDMRDLLLNVDYIVVHNGSRWDLVHLQRLLEIEIKAVVVDSLALSWCLFLS